MSHSCLKLLASLLLAAELSIVSAELKIAHSNPESCAAPSSTTLVESILGELLSEASTTVFAFGCCFFLIQAYRHQETRRKLMLKQSQAKSTSVPYPPCNEQQFESHRDAIRATRATGTTRATRAACKAVTSTVPSTSDQRNHRVQRTNCESASSSGRPLPSTARADRALHSTANARPSTSDLQYHLSSEADVLAAAVRSGRGADLPRLFDRALARLSSIAPTRATSCDKTNVAQQLLLPPLRVCAASQYFAQALVAYDHAASHIGEGCVSIWSVLLYSAVESGAFERCEEFSKKLRLLRGQGAVKSHDFVNIVRYHVQQSDVYALKSLLEDMQRSSQSIDALTWNRALGACCAQGALELSEVLANATICTEPMDAIGFNTLMKCNARAGQLSRCFELRAEMEAKNLAPSEVTFGILLQACVDASDLDRARQVFQDLRCSTLQLNTVHYTTFIKGLIRAGEVKEAESVFEEMLRSPSAKPDIVTYSTLVKAHAELGNISAALQLLQQMTTHDIVPDEIAFNCVLSGCCCMSPPRSREEVFGLFETLLGLRMMPTTATISILLKLLLRVEAWGASRRVLAEMRERFGLAPEMRLYVQVAQACLKAHEGGHASATHREMLNEAQRRGEKIEATLITRLLRQCALCYDFSTAARLFTDASEAGMHLEAQALKMLRDAAMRRGKLSLLPSALRAEEEAS